MPVRIPIQFLTDDLQPAPTPSAGRPLVKIGLIAAVPGLDQDFRHDHHWALIDTGADHNYAEVRLLDQLNCPRIREATVTGATSSRASYCRSVTLVFGPQNAAVGVSTDVYELDSLHDRGKPYHFVIGNLFLQNGVLHMDYVRHEYWFDYYPAPERATAAL